MLIFCKNLFSNKTAPAAFFQSYIFYSFPVMIRFTVSLGKEEELESKWKPAANNIKLLSAGPLYKR
jgi:hypothetical protein